MGQDAKRFTHGTDLERTGLWLFAAAVVLAGLVLIGQALTRTVYAMAESAPALRALGFTHQNLIGGLLLPSAHLRHRSGGWRAGAAHDGSQPNSTDRVSARYPGAGGSAGVLAVLARRAW